MDVKVGQRVVRGPDWKWGSQDGGEGHVGTIVEVNTAATPEEGLVTPRSALVQWDNGSRCNYRCGLDGKYDLLLFDNGPAAVHHPNIVCDACRKSDIEGMRFKCLKCMDFDLCTNCYMNSKHEMNHKFVLLETPDSPRVSLPARTDSSRLMAKGLFKDAEVERGYDWLWGDQDGGVGNIGQLVTVRGWEKDTFNSVAEVEWKKGGKKNVYRVGHKGKVDIKAISPGDGGYYYPDHLPVLGKAVTNTEEEGGGGGGGGSNSSSNDIVAGDNVRVQLDVELFKAMQEGHGGWNDEMAQLLDEVGTVQSVLDSGDIRVRYSSNRVWTLNGAAVTKLSQFNVGDVVKIIDDMLLVHDLQEDHGGWVDDMALSLGQAGRVVKIFPSGDVRVGVNGRLWTYNPLCMRPAPDENPPEAPAEESLLPEGLGGDMDMQLRLLSLLENPAVIVAAAAANDVSTLRDFLTKHPSEVNTKAAGKAALHCAAVAGNVEIIKCILEFSPNLEIEDDDGDKPLHLCAYGDEEEAAKLLIDHGAQVNVKNKKGITPLSLAAIKGHISTMKVLMGSPDIDITCMDSEGNTALHCAVLAQKHEAMLILLNAGANPELINFRLFTPVHEAARIGFLPGMSLFIQRIPECVNMKKDDGLAPLHLASLNNHLDVATTIAECENCDIDSISNDQSTPLHFAVHQGHISVVERLVGFGANLNAQDHDGDTPLHMAMVRPTSGVLGADTPQLKKLNEAIDLSDETTDRVSIVQACFLIQEGADPYILNNKGNTPIGVCSPEKAVFITQFMDRKEEFKSAFHGSLSRALPSPAVPSHATPMTTPTSKHLSPRVSQKVLSSATPVQTNPTVAVSSTAAVSDVECILCEGEVDVRLQPCNCVVLCRQCASRARKCPKCKTRVEGIGDIPSSAVPKCLMCEEEPGVVTLLPCQHRFCQACCRRMKKCSECKQVIESKQGLSSESSDDSSSIATSTTPTTTSVTGTINGGTTLCEICCEEPRNTVLTCGHQFCYSCSSKVDQCPICRKVIQHRIQLFQ